MSNVLPKRRETNRPRQPNTAGVAGVWPEQAVLWRQAAG